MIRLRRIFRARRQALLRCCDAGEFWCGAVAQLGERRVRNAKVRGSIPLGSTNSLKDVHPIGSQFRNLVACHRADIVHVRFFVSASRTLQQRFMLTPPLIAFTNQIFQFWLKRESATR